MAKTHSASQQPTAIGSLQRERESKAFFDELLQLLESQDDVRLRYARLYSLFTDMLDTCTAAAGMEFSGAFAKMHYLCTELRLSHEQYVRLNDFRLRGAAADTAQAGKLAEWFAIDVRRVAEFLAAATHSPLPRVLAARLPIDCSPPQVRRQAEADYLRVVVKRIGEHEAIAACAATGGDICLSFNEDGAQPDRHYLRQLLAKGTQLNLVRPTFDGNKAVPELVVLEPDYLADVTTIASAFESYGATPLAALIAKFKPAANSRALLLGNFAGQLLDEVVRSDGGHMPDYRDSVTQFFRSNALQIATCADMNASFHTDAKAQLHNLADIMGRLLGGDANLRKGHLLLEPSFFCEMLGIQGRMDLMQDDMRLLIEQKSGKREFRTDRHQEKHYVQMLLYLALLHYNFHMKNSDISSYLLYSRYADGLMREGPAPKLLFRAMSLRNRIVADEFSYSRGGMGERLFGLTPDDFNTSQSAGRLWTDYTRPEIERLLQPVKTASQLERLYFNRMVTFVEREQLLAKTGTPRRGATGMASLWQMSPDEKRQSGCIYERLEICGTECGDDGGIVGVTLRIDNDSYAGMPNFRRGDVVAMYRYKLDEAPDMRRTMVIRCSISSIDNEHLCLSLRAPQHNASVFSTPKGMAWAVEHDYMDAGFRTAFRGLYRIFTANKSRRDLLLCRREPQINWKASLTADYSDGGRSPEMNELVLRAKRADDFFLLVGPPGTGKTSFGLMNMLREALGSGHTVLLMAFTNRATDEICSKLVKAEMAFVRIGSPLSCDKAYHSFLLQEQLQGISSARGVAQLVAKARIMVGTVASISAHASALFAIRGFDVAIVDEASQVLEPQMAGLLLAKHGEQDAIGKFILIGDNKQLSAVVMQSEADSRVDEPELRAIGLTNCRRSLFERLLERQKNSAFMQYTLRRQGRMHPAVSDFANRAFYGGQLRAVPLPHQRQQSWLASDDGTPLGKTLAHNRVAFFNSPAAQRAAADKVNLPEAQIIARLVAKAAHLLKLNKQEGSPAESIGIIVPYRNQIALVRRELGRIDPALCGIACDTVERFQGSERDIIVYGFTVHSLRQLDQLASQAFFDEGQLIDRKLNVALTRARKQLLIVGNKALLANNPLFNSLVKYAMHIGAYFDDFNALAN